MIIESADFQDLKKILELQYLAFQSEARLNNDFSIAPLHQTLEEVLEEFRSGTILKAVEDGTIIGSVRGLVSNSRLLIGKLIVHPDHQGKGIGRKLLVATRGGGLAEIVESDCALVSEVGNAQSLSAAIAAAVDLFAPERRQARNLLLDAAQAKSARFSITPINQELAECYRAVLKR